MVWGNVRDVEPSRSDIAAESGQDASQPHDPPVSSPDALADLHLHLEDKVNLERIAENPGPVIFRVLRRLWIPLVVLVVITVGGLTVSRLHGLFGSQKSLSYADTRVDNKPYNPQHLGTRSSGHPGPWP